MLTMENMGETIKVKNQARGSTLNFAFCFLISLRALRGQPLFPGSNYLTSLCAHG